ncbi:MAG: TonB-dependent receptor [Ferruginibacter sp.]
MFTRIHFFIKIFIFTLLFCLPFFLFSQTGNYVQSASVTGRLTNEKNIPVTAASVRLFKEDSILLFTGLTDIKGEFRLAGVAAGNYTIKISHIGFETFITAPFSLKAAEHKILPAIQLKTATGMLKTVMVTGTKPLIEIKPDKIIFNVASSPSASGTNGLDLLKKAPGVSVDIDNNISLLGKQGVEIYLNGVPSRLSGTDLTSFLQSLTSDNIESLEIISNPSSKYDAEGTGGIINIRTKKNVATGFNGSATSSFTKGIYWKSSNNLSLNYGGKKLRANLEFTQSDNTNLEIYEDNKQLTSSILDLYSKDVQGQKSYNIASGVEMQLTKKQVLTINGRVILNKTDNTLWSSTDIYQSMPMQFTQVLSSGSIVHAPSHNYTSDINHFLKFSETANLNTSASFGVYRSDKNTQQPNVYYKPDRATKISEDNTAFDANTNINLWSAKIDYDKEWKRISFSAGMKYAHVLTKNAFSFYNIPNATPVLDPSKSNDFSYKENVAAAYSRITINLDSSFSLSAGIRVENTSSRGLLISQTVVDNKDVPRSYTDLFPNIGLSFDNHKNHSFNLSVGRRITRPNYQDLNPFETPTSQLVVWKGNPFLKPNYTSNYQLTYAYKKKLIITNSYSEIKDFFAKIFETTGNSSTQVIPRNMQKVTNYALSVSYPETINKYWKVLLLANAAHKTYAGNLAGTVIDLKVNQWDYSIQNSFNFRGGYLMDISYNQQSNWIWRGSIVIKGTKDLSFGIRKNFFGSKLQIRITGADILRTGSEFPYEGNYGGIIVKGTYIADDRRFGGGITWKFGNQNVKTKKKSGNGLDEELNRL